jgi:LacI family transcriptional regulator
VRRSSIRDVAARSGTSPTTVSKVLNETPGSAIPLATRDRVLHAARELQYAPSAAAQSLRRRRTRTIGVVTGDLGPFSADIVDGVAAAAEARGQSTILALHREEPELEARQLQLGMRGQVDGLVVVPARHSPNVAAYDALRERGVPFVFVNRHLPGYAADYVGLANEAAAAQLTRGLLAAGATTLAFMSGAAALGSTAMAERFGGFRRALAESGRDPADDALLARPGEEKATFLDRLLRGRPRVDGLLWGSYYQIGPALRVMARHGIRVPDDVRFAGFDRISLTLTDEDEYRALRVLQAPWPTAIQPGRAMGERAVHLLLDAAHDQPAGAPRRLLLQPEYRWLDSQTETTGI